MAEIWKWDTATTAAKVRSGEVGAREVTEAHLQRLDDVNPALNAVTNDVREEALAAAGELDEAAAGGAELGPLHGVPITIKENIDVAGQVTPNGLAVFADLVAPADSPIVTHFKAAGAVIVGRTNAPELSYRWHTDNPLRGETKNPWSPLRTAGGSSGGAASAVAAGIGTIAHGNDLGGSVRQPANCCGLAGIRPSLGRVAAFNPSAPADRTLALQLMSVQGPLGRQVNDVRVALDIMTASSPQDPWHRAGAAAGQRHTPCRVAATYGVAGTHVDDEVRNAIDTARDQLADAGYEIEMVDPPRFDEIQREWLSVLATETAVTGLDYIRSIASADFQRLLGWMFADDVMLDLADYVQAWPRRLTILREWTMFLERYPLVLAPVSQIRPFGPNEDASSAERFAEIMASHAPLVAPNYLGLPSAAVPTVMLDDGPVGVQLIGRPFHDHECLDAAEAIEERVGVMAPKLWDQMSA